MARSRSRPVLCALMCMAFVLAIMLLSGCVRSPARWTHFADPWPVDEPLHDDQAPLCPDSCTI